MQIHTNTDKHYPKFSDFTITQARHVIDLFSIRCMNEGLLNLHISNDLRADALDQVASHSPETAEILEGFYLKASVPGGNKAEQENQTLLQKLSKEKGLKKHLVHALETDADGERIASIMKETIEKVAKSPHFRGQSLHGLSQEKADAIIAAVGREQSWPEENHNEEFFPALKTVFNALEDRANGQDKENTVNVLTVARAVIGHYRTYAGEKPDKLRLRSIAEAMEAAIAEQLKPSRQDVDRTVGGRETGAGYSGR